MSHLLVPADTTLDDWADALTICQQYKDNSVIRALLLPLMEQALEAVTPAQLAGIAGRVTLTNQLLSPSHEPNA